MHRSRRGWSMALAGAALALTPASAHAQFPIYGKDKFLGSINEFTRPLFTQYFNQITPENGGKWGSAAGTTRTAAMRWTAARPGLQLRARPTASSSTSTCCCGATSSRRGWRRCRPRSSSPRSRSGSRPWPSATRTSSGCRSSTRPTWDPPDGSTPKNAGANFASSGNYVQALGGATAPTARATTGSSTAFRLAKQYFPNTKLMLNDVAITGMTASTDEYLKIINILKRENLIDVVGLQAHAFEFIPDNPNVPSIPGHPYEPVDDMRVHKANLDRLAATGMPIQITELDLDGLRGQRRRRATRCSSPTTATSSRPSGSTRWSRASRSGAGGSPTTGATRRTRRSCCPTARSSPPAPWLFNYVRGIAPVIRPDQSVHARRRQREPRRHGRRPTTGPRRSNRPNLRTFTWRHHGRQRRRHLRLRPGTGELRVANPQLLDEHTTYSLKVRVSDGFHESAETDVTVVTGDLANVVDRPPAAPCPRRSSLTLGAPATFGAVHARRRPAVHGVDHGARSPRPRATRP